MAEERMQRKLAAILAADVVGYSRLMGVDEEGTLVRLTAHRIEAIEPCIAEHRGRLVKTTGDGLLAEFASIVDAVRCAVAFQETMKQRNVDVPAERRIDFRIGVNLGDVIVQDEDVYGDGVNVASRLEGLAEAGGICISAHVYDYVRSRLDVNFDDLGPQSMKNIADPVHVYRIQLHKKVSASGRDRTHLIHGTSTVAVLAFENMSGDPEQDYFAEGISEDLLTELSRNEQLSVIGRHSSFAYKGTRTGLRQIGWELGADYLVEGSVRKAGNRVRINAQLIETNSEKHLWAERFDRELDDIFEIQDTVTRAIASQLAVRLKPETGERRHLPTDNIEAYELYSKARVQINPPTRENVIQARRAFSRVIEINPAFAGGYAGLATTHAFFALFDLSENADEEIRRAYELAEQALEIDDRLGWPYIARALAHKAVGDHAAAMVDAERAVEVQPSDTECLAYLGLFCTCAGDGERGIEYVGRALELNPKFIESQYMNFLGSAYCCAGRYMESIATYQANVDRGGPCAQPALANWAVALELAGRHDEAEAKVAELRRLSPEMTIKTTPMHKWFVDPEWRERHTAALSRAGLPN